MSNCDTRSPASAFLPALAAIGAVIIWGASPAATAIAARDVPPDLIGGLRTILGALFLTPLAGRFWSALPRDLSARIELLVGGVAGFAAYPVLLSIGVANTSVMHASLILASAPVFTGLVSFIITRSWPRSIWWIGAAMAITGVGFLLLYRGAPTASAASSSIAGDFTVLLSVLFASVGYVFGGRSSGRIGQWPTTFWSLVAGSLVLLPFIGPRAIAWNWTEVSQSSVLALLFLVLLVTVVGYVLWFWALGQVGAGKVAPLQFGQPVVGVLLAAVLFAEPLTFPIALSAGLTILGVWVARRA
ncbi:DMT family transporter [Epibacterium sp. MM17-32]|uniref:DMT family transporter n=1 Tax=Epibacterium sp. MM17-32 TaxID=2917734 RepID=UPI001EF486F4|nr:DMT family transporter [Epibacterium sp. MM17-32]MCG7626848.1 DMT family transporter [Epibacterium sp. MM17-32]